MNVHPVQVHPMHVHMHVHIHVHVKITSVQAKHATAGTRNLNTKKLQALANKLKQMNSGRGCALNSVYEQKRLANRSVSANMKRLSGQKHLSEQK